MKTMMMSFAVMISLLGLQARAQSQSHPVGTYVYDEDGTSLDIGAEGTVSTGVQGQSDYMAGRMTFAQTNVMGPIRQDVYNISFHNGQLLCQVSFLNLGNGTIGLKKVAGSNACPRSGRLSLGRALKFDSTDSDESSYGDRGTSDFGGSGFGIR